MCGIAGFLDLERRSGSQELAALGRAMAATLNHRGPDAHGVWVDAEAGVALGHTRLSIVDLSPAGAQPMVSSCGSCVISYNGEVYNARDLRPELEARGRRFRGRAVRRGFGRRGCGCQKIGGLCRGFGAFWPG